jgi:hypothetical protein
VISAIPPLWAGTENHGGSQRFARNSMSKTAQNPQKQAENHVADRKLLTEFRAAEIGV